MKALQVVDRLADRPRKASLFPLVQVKSEFSRYFKHLKKEKDCRRTLFRGFDSLNLLMIILKNLLKKGGIGSLVQEKLEVFR